jgi:hypothetical protein
MAFSYVEHNGDGATTNFAVTFPYISKNDVSVTVSGSSHPFTWVNDSTVLITPAPAVGVNNVKISRTTPRSAPLVDFYDTDHDLNAAQLLYLAQEYYDKVLSVVDLGTPLPLAVVQGGTGAAVPADARTNLGLGDMAVQNKAAVDITGGTIAGITDLALADGGTGASSAAAARTNLDVYSKAEADTQTLALAYSKAQIDNLNENPIINPCMDVWQRGVGFVAAANSTYTADRWQYVKAGAVVHDVAQSTNVPTVAESGLLFNCSLYTEVTTADAAIAAGDFSGVLQSIEGYNFRHFAQKDFTLSFWVKATVTGTYCVSFTNSAVDRTYVAEYTINTTNTWEKKVINVTASPSAGTWNYGNGVGLTVRFCLAGGSTFHTAPNAWQIGNFLCTANQVNATGTVANLWRVTGVKLELGSTATPLRYRAFQTELELCQRYYETRSATIWSGEVVNPQVYYHAQEFNTFKRVAPTMAYTFIGQNGFAASAPATFAAESQGFIAFKAANATVSGGFLHYSWTANAEL